MLKFLFLGVVDVSGVAAALLSAQHRIITDVQSALAISHEAQDRKGDATWSIGDSRASNDAAEVSACLTRQVKSR